MRYLFGVLTILGALVLATGTASAQNADGFKRCGDEGLVLVFMNPDLKVQEDGYVHASGTFFIQFQARGERALEIETFKFSFGKPIPDNAHSCDTPEWITGGYLKNYRSDTNWRDGFFVPINTYNVPDGEYAAAVSAYDAKGNELVRYYTKALVENGGRQTPQDPWPVEDFTQPWPMILPGDGEREGGSGLYIEVAEEVSEIKAWVNGMLAPLTEVQAPERDDDAIPDLGYGPLAGTEFSEAQFKKRVWGPAYTWDGVINNADVVKVRVVDVWGNIAEKVVHVGDPTIGGRVVAGNPEVRIEVPEQEQETDANGTALWNVTYVTVTDEGIHGDVYLRLKDGSEIPPEYDVKIKPSHIVMGGKEELQGTVRVTAGPDAPLGRLELKLQVEYLSYDTRVTKEIPLRLVVSDRASTAEPSDEEVASRTGTEQENFRGTAIGSEPNENLTTSSDEPEETPAPGALAAIAAALAGLALRRRGRNA